MRADAERLVRVGGRLAPGFGVGRRADRRPGTQVDSGSLTTLPVDGDVDDAGDAAGHLVEAEEVVAARGRLRMPWLTTLPRLPMRVCSLPAAATIVVPGGVGELDGCDVEAPDRVLEGILAVEVAAERDADDVDSVGGRPQERGQDLRVERRSAPLRDLQRDQRDARGDAVERVVVDDAGDVAADPGAVAVEVDVLRSTGHAWRGRRRRIPPPMRSLQISPPGGSVAEKSATATTFGLSSVWV